MKFKLILLLIFGATLIAAESNAFYNPQTGRWLNRDSIEETGGSHLYAAVGNSPMDGIDALGERLAVTVFPGSDQACGRWSAPRGIGGSRLYALASYIIQEITRDISVRDCNSRQIYSEHHHYWEAFGPFEAGTIVAAGDDWRLDLSINPVVNVNGSRGSDTVNATAKLFSLATTGDLGSLGVPPRGVPPGAALWQPGMDPFSGQLPSTLLQPTWWNNPSLDGPATSSATFTWRCCCPDYPPWNLTLTP